LTGKTAVQKAKNLSIQSPHEADGTLQAIRLTFHETVIYEKLLVSGAAPLP
jgi:hypothetical protein